MHEARLYSAAVAIRRQKQDALIGTSARAEKNLLLVLFRGGLPGLEGGDLLDSASRSLELYSVCVLPRSSKPHLWLKPKMACIGQQFFNALVCDLPVQ